MRPLHNSPLETACDHLYFHWENIDYGPVAEALNAQVGHLSKMIVVTGWEQDWQIVGLGCDRVLTQAEQDS